MLGRQTKTDRRIARAMNIIGEGRYLNECACGQRFYCHQDDWGFIPKKCPVCRSKWRSLLRNVKETVRGKK